jgi:hypothetical protein
LTVCEVAARLKLTPKSVRNRMYDGTWRRGEHWFSRPGIGPRFKWSALVAWIEESDAANPPPAGGRAFVGLACVDRQRSRA